MWIRSQDRKTLVNADKFSISKEHEVFRIYSVNSFLGEYSTEEKALKVMDMIEDRIRLSEMFKLHIYEPLNRTDQFVFYMPDDSVLNGEDE